MLDALPGEVRAGEAERKDHPADLIETLRRIVLPVRSRATLQEQLLQAGFSSHIARWTTTNLRPINGDPTCAPSCKPLLLDLQRSHVRAWCRNFFAKRAQPIIMGLLRSHCCKHMLSRP